MHINIWPVEREYDSKISRFFEDIFYIHINRLIRVSVIPAFEQDREWIRTHAHLEDIADVNDARVVSQFYSDFVITMNDKKAGGIEVIDISQGPEDKIPPVILFYIATEEYTRLTSELSELCLKTNSVHDYIESTLIENTFTGKAIKAIIDSEYFTQEHQNIISRPFTWK